MRLTKLGKVVQAFAALSFLFSALAIGGTMDYQAATGNYESGTPTLLFLVAGLSAATLWVLEAMKRN